METFESPGSFVEYDAMGNIVKGSRDDSDYGHAHDLEAQQIKDEFKRPPY